MADTERTIAAVMSLLADGQQAGSISPQDVRDAVQTLNQRRYYLSVKDKEYGCVGDGTTDDTTGFQAAIDAAIAANKPLYVPPGTYKTTAGLTADCGTSFAMFGAGGYRSIIAPTSNTAYDCIVIGSGSGSGVRPSGYLRDICFIGPSDRPSGYKRGVYLSAMRQFELTNVYVSKFSIGFDFKDNCYGCFATNLRTLFAECNVGLNLQTGPVSGSDMTFRNCWFGGNTAAVHIAGGGGGFHFYGGQMISGGALGAADDTLGTIITGKDYETGAVGTSGGISFYDIDFEGTAYAWIFRVYNPTTLLVEGCGFNATSASTPAIGILKATAGADHRFTFINNNIQGYWSTTAGIIVVTGAGSAWQLNEMGWHSLTPASLGGVSQSGTNWMWSLAGRAAFDGFPPVMGIGMHASGNHSIFELTGTTSIWFRNNAGAYEKSTDFGSNWAAV